jgi:hypothetical protein
MADFKITPGTGFEKQCPCIEPDILTFFDNRYSSIWDYYSAWEKPWHDIAKTSESAVPFGSS